MSRKLVSFERIFAAIAQIAGWTLARSEPWVLGLGSPSPLPLFPGPRAGYRTCLISGTLTGQNQRVVCIEGDSAFGFSGMELETVYRYRLPITFVIINNNGIYSGISPEAYTDVTEAQLLALRLPPTSLLPATRYDRLTAAFNG
jgi:hypothetical protein